MAIIAQSAWTDHRLGDLANVIWHDDAHARRRMAQGAGPAAARTLAGLRVHSSTTRATLALALADAVPSVAAALPTEIFSDLAQSFIAAHPPRRAALYDWGDEFPDFLSRANANAELVALARLDGAWFAALFAAEAAPITATCLTGLTGPAVLSAHLKTHPSLQTIQLDGTWLTAWFDRSAVPQLECRWQPGAQGNCVALVRPRARVVAMALSPAGFEFLAALHRGEALVHAAEHALVKEPGFDLQSTLAALFADGVFSDCLTGEDTR